MRKVILIQLILIVSVVSSFGQWQTSGSNIYYNNGNVGIGTSNTEAKVHINNGPESDAAVLATSSENNKLFVRSGIATNIGDVTFTLLHSFSGYRDNGFIKFHRGNSATGGFLSFGSWGLERMRIAQNGSVGIGTANIIDQAILDVRGQSVYFGNTSQTSNYGIRFIVGDQKQKITTDYSGGGNTTDLSIQTYDNNDQLYLKSNGNIGIGTTTPNDKLSIYGNNAVLSIRSNVGGEWGIKFYGHSGIEIGGFKPNGSTGEIKIGGFLSTYFSTFYSGGSEAMRITSNGSVGIGTTSPDHKLDVVGTIRAHEVLVNTQKTADFVFEDNYLLKPLKEVEQFIAENKHLPDIAPADTMLQNGVNMGEFQIQLLQKIEELTLYMIQQEKKIEGMTEEIKELKREVNEARSY